jgi:RimJ/RimL family protein N-acetyltransferase
MFNYDLFLRKADKSDLREMYDLKQEASEFHHRVAILNDEDQSRWFDVIDRDVYHPNNLVLIGIDPEIDESVGVLFLTNINYINGTADVGCDIYKNYRGKGFGNRLMKSGIRFCREILNMRKLSCEVLDFNIVSQKMCERCGFVREGVRIQHVYKGSKYVDSVIYGCFLRD